MATRHFPLIPPDFAVERGNSKRPAVWSKKANACRVAMYTITLLGSSAYVTRTTERCWCLYTLAATALFALAACAPALAEEAPRIVQKDGRFALLVDGKPISL